MKWSIRQSGGLIEREGGVQLQAEEEGTAAELAAQEDASGDEQVTSLHASRGAALLSGKPLSSEPLS